MADIFISYVREDLSQARRLAEALEARGWSVWWDRDIPAGRTFDDVIEEEIEKTRCLIVLWSPRSVDSRWVRTEAAEGAQRDILVPISIEECAVPLAFKRIQTADLAGWDGTGGSPQFQELVDDLARLLEPPPGQRERRPGEEEPTPSPAPAPAPSVGAGHPAWLRFLLDGGARRKTLGLTGLAAVLLVVLWLARGVIWPEEQISQPVSLLSEPEAEAGGDDTATTTLPEFLLGTWRGQVRSSVSMMTDVVTDIEIRIRPDELLIDSASPYDQCAGRLEITTALSDQATFQYRLTDNLKGQCLPTGTIVLSRADEQSIGYVFQGGLNVGALTVAEFRGTLNRTDD